MLRNVLLYLSQASWAKAIVTHVPLARRVALRFVAGESLDEAIKTAHALNQQGLLVTLDYLGESVAQAADTEAVVKMYTDLLTRIQQDKLNASVSLKLTHLGLDISEDLCVTNLRHIMTASHGILITIDMESSAYTDRTLRIYRTMRDEYDFDNIATVIQSALRRSSADMEELAAEGAHIRLVKGAYLEPEDVAYPEKADVDHAFMQIMRRYLQSDTPVYLDIATHDENMIQAAKDFVALYAVPPSKYEFQMLYGIRTARQLELAGAGDKVRVYVPFGEAWYPYFMRRLAERPANLWFFAKSLFSR
ncbi:MAG: proline dehydrogenase [Anaerolineae bacterium]